MLERSASGFTIALRPGTDLVEPVEIVLSEVPLFAAAGPEVIARLAERASRVRVAAGDWLLRAGDPADSMYVVASGRVEAVLEDGSVVRTLARGDVIGELALLTGAPRSASVRARRDADLVRLAGSELAEVLRTHPEAAIALTRALSQQLQDSRAREVAAPPVPSTIALVPLHPGLPMGELRDVVMGELRRGGRVVQLDGSGAADDAERGRLLDRVEPDHDQVLLMAGGADERDPWTAFCLRQADRIVAVAGADAAPSRALAPLRGADLAFVASDGTASGIHAWSDALAPARRYLLPSGGLERGARRMARRLSGRSVGVVLSGGGARGSAHLGVIEELLAAGVEIDRIGGTSMGAMVAGLFASGASVDEAAAAMARELIERNPLSDYTVPLVALTRGRRAEGMIRRLCGERTIESLELDFFAVAADLIANEAVEFRSGPLAEAVGSSAAIPGYVPPVALGDRLLVDGGVLNNLPVELMARDEGPVIAVNVGSRSAPPPRPTRFRRPRTRRAAAAVRRIVTGVDAPRLGFGQALMRSVVLDGADPAAALDRHADVVIAPDVGGVDLLDWRSMPAMRAAGREATRDVLASTEVPGSLWRTPPPRV